MNRRLAGLLADRQAMQMNIPFLRQHPVKPIRGFRQRLKGIDPRIRKAVARNQGELPAVGANIHHMPASDAIQDIDMFRARRST